MRGTRIFLRFPRGLSSDQKKIHVSVMARGHLSIDSRSVSAILTNVTHKEAARSQRRDERTPQSWNYLVPRRWYTKGTEGWLRAAALPAGFLSQIDLRSHPTEPPHRPCNTGGYITLHGIHPSEPHHTFIYASLYSFAGRHCLAHRVTGNMCCLLSRTKIAATNDSMN